MGNCLAITSNSPRPLPQQEEPNKLEEDYGHQIISTTRSNTPFLGTPDQMISETGTRTGQSSPSKVLDPRLVSLLDFFRQLYARRNDIFIRIIPAHQEAFEDIFNKMGVNLLDDDKKKGRKLVMQRSNSFGDVEEVRLRMFKVKPIDSGGATPPNGGGSAPGGSSGGGGGGGGTNKPGGSK